MLPPNISVLLYCNVFFSRKNKFRIIKRSKIFNPNTSSVLLLCFTNIRHYDWLFWKKAFASVVHVWKKKHLIKVDWMLEIYHHARPPLPSARCHNRFGQVRQEMVKSYFILISRVWSFSFPVQVHKDTELSGMLGLWLPFSSCYSKPSAGIISTIFNVNQSNKADKAKNPSSNFHFSTYLTASPERWSWMTKKMKRRWRWK